MPTPRTHKRKIGDPVTCTLCGGDGYVSEETAAMGGRYHGDTTCPACNGECRCPWHPLCGHPPCMGLASCNDCLRCHVHCTCPRPGK